MTYFFVLIYFLLVTHVFLINNLLLEYMIKTKLPTPYGTRNFQELQH